MAKVYEIHPSIGIVRVGTSEQFFLGPEPGSPPPARYRDDAGNLLRQACRFAVFECDRDPQGGLLTATELTGSPAKVEWTVELANRKGAAANFAHPGLRNANHANRDELAITPGPRTITGPNQSARFDTGLFLGTPVFLGEIRTEVDGRLVVLGGHGFSDFVSPSSQAVPLVDFADNDFWHDDVSDGPVRARVTLPDGSVVEAKPAWVIAAPPDYAPEVSNFITLYDVALQAAVDRGWRGVPTNPSFTRDVLPILSRTVGYQWVNRAARAGHGTGREGDFVADVVMLADPATPQSQRRRILRRLRDPNQAATGQSSRGAMPRLHDETNSSQVLAPTRFQYAVLKAWSEGNFIADRDIPTTPEPRPDALDRAALEAGVGGPFFPGIEAGSILKDASLYVEPLRLDASRLQPGQITQGSAVPWQADFYACSWEPQGFIGWWPAQRPDHVLTELTSDTLSDWDRGISGYEGMVQHWHHLGIVVQKMGPAGQPVFVESERQSIPGGPIV